MSSVVIDRRSLIRRAALLGVGAAGVLVVRGQMSWPTPEVRYARGRSSGWLGLPTPGGLIDLPAKVGWAPIRAVVDSGAQYSAIDATLALRLNLPKATPLPMVAFGVSGAPSLTQAVRLDADLGAFSLKGLRAAALDLRPLSGLTRQPFSLLLGRDFLRAVIAEVDFPGGRAAFFTPEAWTPPAQAQAVPVHHKAGALMVPVGIEQAPSIEVLLDTGATGALALAESTAKAAGLLDGRPLTRSDSVTLGGVSQDGITQARQVRFAGRTLADVPVQIYRPPPNSPAPGGLLGLGVLRRFHLALDHAGGRMFLIGDGKTASPAPPVRFRGGA